MQIRGRQLAFTWIGCFLGAGFVSGQEISQFFTHFGLPGLVGQIGAVVLLSLLCGVIFTLSRRMGRSQVHEVAVPTDNRVLKALAGGIAVCFMYGIYVVMCAGAGTLLEQLTGSGTLRLVGGVVFCALITWIATRGMGGAVRVFSRIMPLLVILSLVVVAAALAMFGRNGIQFVPATTRNPMVNHWLLAAVTFVSYNLLCALGTLSSLGTMARSDRDIRVGAALGGVILLVISLGINGAMAALPASTSAELPMLYLAQQLSPVLEGVYALVILLGMFGASMSVFVPVPQYLFRFRRLEGHPVLVPVVLSVGAFFLSQVGFSDLIGTLFPVFGFLGFVFIGGILCNAWRALRKKSQAEEVTVTGGGHGTNQ